MNGKALRVLDAGMLAIGGAAMLALLAEYGFGAAGETARWLHVGEFAAAYLFCFLQVSKLGFVPSARRYLRRNWFEFALVLVITFQLFAARGLEQTPEYAYLSRHGSPAPLAAASLVIAQLYFLAVGAVQSTFLQRCLLRLHLKPAATMAASFAATIGLVALGLLLPMSAAPGRDISWVDALFTATSAVCVTGLTVVDTGTAFSALGQCLILAGIQVGGLGILTLTAFAAVFSGEGLLGQEAREIGFLMEARNIKELRRLVVNVVLLAALVEAAGALLLYGPMGWHVRDPFLRAFYAVFHSVSAFCNAGFGLFPDSLGRFRGSTIAMGVFMMLITCGSIGFSTLQGLPRAVRKLLNGRWKEVPRHVRVVLSVNAALVSLGAAAFYLLERDGFMRGMGAEELLLNSLFIPVTARTCGFQTFDLGAMGALSACLVIALMWVGGSPGSTAGGFKTTVLAVGLAGLRARLTGRPAVLAGRPVDQALREKSHLVFTGLTACIAIGAVSLMTMGAGSLIQAVFEAASAVGTVGLSMGITPGLSAPAKLLLVACMFAGRVLPAYLVLRWLSRNPGVPAGEDPVGVG